MEFYQSVPVASLIFLSIALLFHFPLPYLFAWCWIFTGPSWSSCNLWDLGSIPGLGRSPGEGNGYPFQYSCLENSMDCIVHGVAKSQIWQSDFHFMIYKHWDENSTCPISFQASPQSCKIGNILRFIFQVRKLRLGEYPTESGRVLLGGAEL